MSFTHYCIVKSGLSKGLTCAMLCHAAGESSPGKLPKNTRVVALETQNLWPIATKLKEREIDHHLVFEDDDELYAIGIAPTDELSQIKRVTSSLPLIR